MPEDDQSTWNPDRRSVLKGMAGVVVGAGLGIGSSRSTAIASPAPTAAKSNSHQAALPIWKLSRPKPALPNSYFWTWDHSTNWMLDDPGMLNFGCDNRYLKRPETYVEDYRRLTDLAAGLGVKGILIWGFLREAHGGVGSAKRVADYAAANRVAIKPGVGTNMYGGVYYEGDHPSNTDTFLKKYPDARSVDEKGQPRASMVCPTYPGFKAWLTEGVQWLFREFNIGGANVENGDFLVCHCPRCKKLAATHNDDEPLFWQHQLLGYAPVMAAIGDQLADKFVTWATYKGFVPGSAPKKQKHMGAYMQCQRPAVVDKLPKDAICQWTLSGMVHQKALPLTTFLDNGVPAEALSNQIWAADVKPPSRRGVGYMHQGTQWYTPKRYDQVVSTIKEGCLRSYRAGLEGVSIQGEVSTMHLPWALNYLAFSHFIHWPEDSLRDWGRKTLGQVLGSEDEGEAFAELFAHYDAGSLTDAQRKDLDAKYHSLQRDVSRGRNLQRYWFWRWLYAVAENHRERHTVSTF